MWTKLPQELLVRVFMCLNMLDVVAGVSHTCKSWRNACKDPTLWRRIDLNAVNANIIERPLTWSEEAPTVRLMGLLKCALNFSAGAATCLIFHLNVPVTGEDFIYIAARTPNLKTLFLPWLTLGNLDGFVEAVKQWWKGLESVTLQPVGDCNILMEALGENCKRLSHLKIMCAFQLGLAMGICSHLPRLKALSVRYTLVHKEAVLHVLRTLTGLEALNLSHVLMVDSAEGRVVMLRQLDAEVAALGAKLKRFLTCMRGPCASCSSSPRDSLRLLLPWRHSNKETWGLEEEDD